MNPLLSRKRKIIVFIIATLILIGMVAILVVSKTPTKLIPEEPGNIPVRTPQISTFFPNKGISYKLSVDKFETPESLPLIKITPPRRLSESEVVQIAKTAGLDEVFTKIINSQEQRLYTFKSNSVYFIVYADTGEISYKSYSETINLNKKLSADEIISIAKKFLSDKFSFREDILSLSSIKHYDNEEYETLSDPTQPHGYYEVNFAPALTGYKVVTVSPDQSPIKVTVADDGTVGKVNATLVYNSVVTQEKYPIKTFEDIKSQLDEAVIVQAYTADLYGQTFPADSITSINIEKIEVAYWAGSTTSTSYYQPIFLLEGTGSSDKTPRTLTVSLYLPALKK